MNYYANFSLAGLIEAIGNIENRLEKLGKEYDAATPSDFILIDDVPYSAKEQLGEQIYDCYSEIGYIRNEIKARSNA